MRKDLHNKIRKSEYKRLEKEVNKFNRYLQKITTKENKKYLPEALDVEFEKTKVITRQELNRRIKELKKFYEKDATKKVTLEGGNEITKWEHDIIKKPLERATKRLNKELKALATPKEGEKYSRLQMGSTEANAINKKLRDFADFGKVKFEKQTFEKLKNRIMFQGGRDYELRKATVYRQNIMSELKILGKNDEEFKKLYEEFNKIKNPIQFFKTMQKSNLMQEFFEWYKEPDHFGGFVNSHDIAKTLLKEYGLPYKKYIKVDKKYLKLDRNQKYTIDKSIKNLKRRK